jgi:hypothetical protein
MLSFLASACLAQTTVQYIGYYIEVANKDSVFQELIQTAESKGGYFTKFDDFSLQIRVPVSALQEFQLKLGSLAKIKDKKISSEDESANLEKYTAQIESRKKLLETYMGMVKNAPLAELQAVEREMVNLNRQIENLQGDKQAIERRAALALVTINASLPPPNVNKPNQISLFKWINATNLNSLREDF